MRCSHTLIWSLTCIKRFERHNNWQHVRAVTKHHSKATLGKKENSDFKNCTTCAVFGAIFSVKYVTSYYHGFCEGEILFSPRSLKMSRVDKRLKSGFLSLHYSHGSLTVITSIKKNLLQEDFFSNSGDCYIFTK